MTPHKRRQAARLELFETHRRCQYCGRVLSENTATLDHKVPVHRGGLDEPANWALACAPCNNAKSGWTLDEWKERFLRGLFRVA